MRYIKCLKGSKVWGGDAKNVEGVPSRSRPSGVLGYDLPIRKICIEMNRGHDIKSAFEHALAEAELREMHFTAAFMNGVNTEECKAFTAPGLKDRFPMLAAGKKKSLPGDPGLTEDSSSDVPRPGVNAERTRAKRPRQTASMAAGAQLTGGPRQQMGGPRPGLG